MIQSTLFQSPYSGCPRFSGWKPDPCPGPPPSAYPPQQTSQPPRYSVDKYRVGMKSRNGYWWDIRANPSPPRAAIRYVGPVQGGKFTVSGPSSSGPFTVRSTWGHFGVSNAAAGRLG